MKEIMEQMKRIVRFTHKILQIPRIRATVKAALWTAGLLMFLLFLFLAAIHFLMDKEVIKKAIYSQVLSRTTLTITYDSVDSVFFPLPGVEIHSIHVRDEDKTVAKLESLVIIWNLWALFQGNFELSSIHLLNGELYIHRTENGKFALASKLKNSTNKDGELPSKSDDEKSSGAPLPDDLLATLPGSISIENFDVLYSDDYWKRKDHLRIETLEFDLDAADREILTSIDIKFNESPLHITYSVSLEENKWSYEDLRLDLAVESEKFELDSLSDIFQAFPNGDFANAFVGLRLYIKKNDSDKSWVILEEASVKDLRTKKQKSIPTIRASASLYIYLKQNRIQLQNFQYEQEGLSHASVQGNASFQKGLQFDTNLQSQSLNLDGIREWLNIFTTVDRTRSVFLSDIISNMNKTGSNARIKQSKARPPNPDDQDEPSNAKSRIELDLHRVTVARHFLSSIQGEIAMEDKKLEFPDIRVVLYGGSAIVRGTYYIHKPNNYMKTRITTRNVDMDRLISRMQKEKLITGKLDSDTEVSMFIGPGKTIPNTLNLKSEFKITKGELLSYANIVGPIATIGKIINITEWRGGKSTSFNSITGRLTAKNRLLTLNKFQMDGVGVDASGSGTYTFDNKIDMRFTASFSGLAGKAVKIPIVYNGTFGKTLPYLDPIWLASVYAGTILLPGMGMIVGGLAGSAASETVRDVKDAAIDTAESIYSSTKNFLFGGSKKKKSNK